MSTSLFQNASQFSTGDVIIGNNTNHTINNYFNGDNPRDPLELLLKHTTKEATHESVTYSYAPTCHPSTRKIIKTDLMDFINDSRKRRSLRLAWLSGPAGAGKSCIQRTIVEECLAGHILGGSFFFGGDVGRDHADGFVATIAHQLCNVVPDFREAMLRKISFNPSIFEKSLIVQTRNLVLDPLEAVYESRDWIQPTPITIIVDGLDECRDSAQRLQVVHLLRTLTKHPTFPFCAIVSSRPEFDIVTAFAEEPYRSVTRKFLLHNYDSDEDLMAYIVEEFARIRRAHPQGFEGNWPTQLALERLVKMASGQFIFVSTVIRYVENGLEHPERLLDQVLTVVSTRVVPRNVPANPFAELDALYTGVLRDQVTPALVKRTRQILHAILEIWRVVETNSLLTISGNLELGPSTRILDVLFGFAMTGWVLSRLSALLHVPRNGMENRGDNYIRFYHKSMEDYLKTEQRSRNFFQTEADTVAHLVIASIQNLERWSLSLGSPSEDKAATFSALYLCIRFGWDGLPTYDDVSTLELEDNQLAKALKFDATILLGWILLYGRRLWPNPNDMLNHMKPQSVPLGGLRDHWLDPITEGVKIFHTCERSRLLKWKNKCPSLCETVGRCSRNSRSVFSFLEENWYLERQEKIGKLGDLDEIVFSGSSRREKVQKWVRRWIGAQDLSSGSSGSGSSSGSPGPAPAFDFPSKSTRSLSVDSWGSRSSFGSGSAGDRRVVSRSSSFVSNNNVGPSVSPVSPSPRRGDYPMEMDFPHERDSIPSLLPSPSPVDDSYQSLLDASRESSSRPPKRRRMW